ncbi:HET-domain-containing protein [Annulohypoxylon truncatum]|uniref:HET-domain-containing protein n=1 Tax=Annulohypoxylon truncatum TaxID=327061 RepID=UPI002008B146|nr:HET-domain-containing protein [Annulohypoxylon truncatum]KAI1211058.1 HET-domain-containing protein [Annulohypoxylon truncatum]
MFTDKSTPFCDKCNAVLFDDSIRGGSIAQRDNGEEYLRIGDKDESESFDIGFQFKDSYPGLPSLSKSAKAGCKFCSFLKETVVNLDQNSNLFEPRLDVTEIEDVTEIQINMEYAWQRNVYKTANGLHALEINIYGNDSEGQERTGATVTCSVESAPGPCASWLRLNINRPGCVLRPDTISWIQNNLDSTAEDFSRTHPDKEFVPTRLVRVDCQPPRLIETRHSLSQGDKGSFRYAAISYCWGSPEQARSQLKTERSSLSSRLSSIEEHEMTQVLKDAVTTCRALAISYLWIDTLCIIQDNSQDWDRESASLSQIYGNAYLTICALSSDSCNGSFLNREPAQIEIPFTSKVRPDIRGSYNLRVDPFLRYYEMPGEDVGRSTWESRAWTFQEKAASVRMLAFNKSDIHFISPWRKQTQYEGDMEFYDRSYFQIAQLGCYKDDTDQVIDLWYNKVLPGYSKRLLTHKKDRLPALSGIAQHFSRLLDDEYLAGLWKRDLYRGLSWNCSYDNPQPWDDLIGRLGSPSEYVAPSWSWATYTGLTDFSFGTSHGSIYMSEAAKKRENLRSECRVLKVNVTPNGVDPFGQIKAASLQITAKICSLPADIYPSERKLTEATVGNCLDPFAYCCLDWRPNILREPRREVMMLLLGTVAVLIHKVKSYGIWAFGLLINPVPEKDKYHRVGIFCSAPRQRWSTRLFNDCPERTVVLI